MIGTRNPMLLELIIGMKGARDKIGPAEKTKNFKKILKQVKLFNWEERIICEHPDNGIKVGIVENTKKLLKTID